MLKFNKKYILEIFANQKIDTSIVDSLPSKKIDNLTNFMNKLDTTNPMYEIQFILYEAPKAAPRPRTTTVGGFARWYDPASANKKKIRKLVKEMFPDDWEPIKGEVHLYIKLYRPLIKSLNVLDTILALIGIIRPIQKPDVDNLAKQLMDAINKFVYEDDSQVVSLHMEKFYSDEPRTEVIVEYRDNPVTTKISK